MLHQERPRRRQRSRALAAERGALLPLVAGLFAVPVHGAIEEEPLLVARSLAQPCLPVDNMEHHVAVWEFGGCVSTHFFSRKEGTSKKLRKFKRYS